LSINILNDCELANGIFGNKLSAVTQTASAIMIMVFPYVLALDTGYGRNCQSLIANLSGCLNIPARFAVTQNTNTEEEKLLVLAISIDIHIKNEAMGAENMLAASHPLGVLFYLQVSQVSLAELGL
jgi:hypothetical protein